MQAMAKMLTLLRVHVVAMRFKVRIYIYDI